MGPVLSDRSVWCRGEGASGQLELVPTPVRVDTFYAIYYLLLSVVFRSLERARQSSGSLGHVIWLMLIYMASMVGGKYNGWLCEKEFYSHVKVMEMVKQ